MKKQLLLFILPMLLLTATMQAQTHTWDFGLNSGGFWLDLPQMAANSPDQTIDGLTFVAGTAAFGGMRNVGATATFADGYTPVQEWQSQGSSQGTSALPARRYFSFPVSGDVDVKVWFRVNGTGGRTGYIGDGTNTLASATSELTTDGLIMLGTYTGGAGTIYISSSASVNYMKIQVGPVGTLGLDAKISSVSTNVQAVGSRVYVSNVKSSSEISIYSITGALVKSFKTNSDTNFAFKSGLYIATIKTLEGQKSVKLLLN
ncbi:hypothetical protein CJ739_1033 [Mariniflexile rhizosphaerae]|uniref:T9SS type A sorting domain-containing protein n=1 Tax=unclassified Mariniflexile TaxID=2643887 RepID=UPI000E32DCEA|nr:T9SS type A sorting domain-containing protein [Mariniflexile sp. TRM1-10]AXP80126.1 hypothetical protein CJ739_1033 [Mariniflexile sp. TRM1-10]